MDATEAHRSAQRAANRQRSRTRRANMTEAQREQERTSNRARHRSRWLQMTELQREHQRAVWRDAARTRSQRRRLSQPQTTELRHENIHDHSCAILPHDLTTTTTTRAPDPTNPISSADIPCISTVSYAPEGVIHRYMLTTLPPSNRHSAHSIYTGESSSSRTPFTPSHGNTVLQHCTELQSVPQLLLQQTQHNVFEPPPSSEPRTLNSDSDSTSTASNSTRAHCYRTHNTARISTAAQQILYLRLRRPELCVYCHAKLFDGETASMCCNNGRVRVPTPPFPRELYNLFTSNTVQSRAFRRYIRSYNHVFSFTSMGVKLDRSLAADQHVIYTFRAHGAIYHHIGSLLPPSNTRPRYLQLYIYDTEHEIDHRLEENSELDRSTLQKLKLILDTCNPFVQTLRRLSEREDIINCKLLIKERPSREPQYVLPTAPQVAAIIIGAEDSMDSNERNIIVETTEGDLCTVQEYTGFYDPLQYPLLLPHGTYGWIAEYTGLNNFRVSCCDYYSYILQVRNTHCSSSLYCLRFHM
ncbi:hypothetical protein KSP39_PZI007040 [Platanthera zijinensis]|uniref:Helitron helicase-like domain-containing protein n=1 Tax=Platanthera zijinensis TaxID=2320716 RepID=A0AAP0BQ44_9ASPA